MGVGTGYTLLQGHAILYNVAPRFKSLTVITVFWVVLRTTRISPTCDADNDMFFIISLQDS